MAEVTIDVTDCRDCPFRENVSEQGSSFERCSNKNSGRGAYRDILWGCRERFTKTPEWCPLGLGGKTMRTEEKIAEVSNLEDCDNLLDELAVAMKMWEKYRKLGITPDGARIRALNAIGKINSSGATYFMAMQGVWA